MLNTLEILINQKKFSDKNFKFFLAPTMFGIFGGAQQILIVVATLLVIFSLLGCAMCYWRCRGEHSSYVLNPAMTMPINKPPEREFYV